MGTRWRGTGKETLGWNGGEELPGARAGSQDGRRWPGNERRHNGVGFGVKALVPRIENIVK